MSAGGKAGKWERFLPDSDILVLIRTRSTEYPIVLGFHDGECWRLDSDAKVGCRVVGWMHLHDAAKLLDQKEGK